MRNSPNSDTTARIFVISGPPGVGKGTLVARVRERLLYLDLTVSCTTRSPRKGEKDGVQYHFVSDADFDAYLEHDAFLEWAWVHGHRYGTLKSEIDARLDAGHSVILEIDVQGGMNVKKLYPDAVTIFIKPPSFDELKARLIKRGSETPESLKIRLTGAKRELKVADLYDVQIINDDLDSATDRLVEIIESLQLSRSNA